MNDLPSITGQSKKALLRIIPGQIGIVIFSGYYYYLNGTWRGLITAPALIVTLGFVILSYISCVVHSGPTCKLNDLSYCSLVSNGYGTAPDAKYFEF
jgi:hypothetical protein